MKSFTLRNSLKVALIPFLTFGFVASEAYGVTIFTENIGTGSGTQTIAATTFQNSGTYTYSGTGDTRTSTPSTGYTGASGAKNVFLTNNSTSSFQIADIVTTGYTNFALTFGAHKSTTASNMTELVVEYSTDGTNYFPLTFPAQPAVGGSAVWRLVTITGGTIPAAANLRLRWRNTSSAPAFRIDDITLTGDVSGTNTSVQFASTGSTVSEGVGTVDLTLEITDEDPSIDTEVDVVITVGAPGRVNSYTTQTVTFLGGSSADETLTITVTDNGLCDGDATITFELQNITGGQGTAVSWSRTMSTTWRSRITIYAPALSSSRPLPAEQKAAVRWHSPWRSQILLERRPQLMWLSRVAVQQM